MVATALADHPAGCVPDPAELAVLASRAIVDAVRLLAARCTPPLLVAIDGPCGSGKSTVAVIAAAALRATLVSSDDFFAAEIANESWDAQTPAERARRAIDWRRLRHYVLESVLARVPTDIIVLEGAYSSRPELADLIAFSVLVDAPPSVRDARLAAREDAAAIAVWHSRWDEAESHYFTHVRPPTSFDLVVRTG